MNTPGSLEQLTVGSAPAFSSTAPVRTSPQTPTPPPLELESAEVLSGARVSPIEALGQEPQTTTTRVDTQRSNLIFEADTAPETESHEHRNSASTLTAVMREIHSLLLRPQEHSERISLLPAQLNEALQREPCFTLEHYQTRLAFLRSLLQEARQISGVDRLCSVIHQHLIHAEQAAKNLYQSSADPVQDSRWPLYQRILNLPTLQAEPLGAAVALLKEKLPYADNQNPIVQTLRELLPSLHHPAHQLWQQPNADLNAIKLQWKTLLYRLEKSPEGYTKTFLAPLQSIVDTYQNFIEELQNASAQRREALLTPKAQLSGVGLGFFSLDQEVARTLLSLDAAGRKCKTNLKGIHDVAHEEGVFYKPNPKGMAYIHPEMEFMVYTFYQLIAGEGAAPTTLAKIDNVLFDGEKKPYGRVLQAGFGVDGMPLEDLLGMMLLELIFCFALWDSSWGNFWKLKQDYHCAEYAISFGMFKRLILKMR